VGDHDTIEFYRDAEGQVRWRYQASGNNEVLADGAQGYSKIVDAVRGAMAVTGTSLGGGADHTSITASAAMETAEVRRPDGSKVHLFFADELF
jgi:uncharacterized protein YegP (UPF0339 family)